jgi:hypothetical protein
MSVYEGSLGFFLPVKNRLSGKAITGVFASGDDTGSRPTAFIFCDRLAPHAAKLRRSIASAGPRGDAENTYLRVVDDPRPHSPVVASGTFSLRLHHCAPAA